MPTRHRETGAPAMSAVSLNVGASGYKRPFLRRARRTFLAEGRRTYGIAVLAVLALFLVYSAVHRRSAGLDSVPHAWGTAPAHRGNAGPVGWKWPERMPVRIYEWMHPWAGVGLESEEALGTPIIDGLEDELDLFGSDAPSLNDGAVSLEAPGHPQPGEGDQVLEGTLDSDGLMYVKGAPDAPHATHPILELIRRAEKQWNEKLQRQSKTLEEAVAEYKRRYKRNPPYGFDKWWEYAVENNVVLKDEYDQIFRDLQPFWALEPHDFMHRSRVMLEREETFTLHVEDGWAYADGSEAHLERATDLVDLINRFSEHIPGNINMTFTRHDQPAVQLQWPLKARMLELAAVGEHISPSDYAPEDNPDLSNWAQGCPTGSKLRNLENKAIAEGVPYPDEGFMRLPREWYIPPAEEREPQRGYVYEHFRAMDVCRHPEYMPLHGFTTSPGTNAGPLVPLFTFAKTTTQSDVLVTPLEQYSPTYIGYDPDFFDKAHDKLQWRGSTTGAENRVGVNWMDSQRSRLHFMTHESQGERKILWSDADGPTHITSVPVKELNDEYMDTAFAGDPVQCDSVTCDLMNRIIQFKPTMGLDDSYQYKYVIDVDGNGWSGRFHRLMSTKSLVLKTTMFPEWYAERIQPWLHYVPVKVDYSDLYDIMTFFRGLPGDRRGAHEDLAAKMAMAGKVWARDHWRMQDMASYMFRLCLEWSRLYRQADPFAQLDFFL